MQIFSLRKVERLLLSIASSTQTLLNRMTDLNKTEIVGTVTVSISGTPSVNATITAVNVPLQVLSTNEADITNALWVNGYLQRVRS